MGRNIQQLQRVGDANPKINQQTGDSDSNLTPDLFFAP